MTLGEFISCRGAHIAPPKIVTFRQEDKMSEKGGQFSMTKGVKFLDNQQEMTFVR